MPETTETPKTTRKKKVVAETPTNHLTGFGENVVKLTDSTSGEILAYVGKQNGEEKVHFAKPITVDQLEDVYELLQKKKFNKHISKERFNRAQEYADRKF